MKPTVCCLNEPIKENPLLSFPQLRTSLIKAQTQKEQNQAMWEALIKLGILSNMSEDEKEGIKPLQNRFS